MARVKIEKVQTLEQLIPEYGVQNTECNALKKKVSELNTKIKEAIKNAKQENTEIIVDGWKCSLTVSDESTLNEDRLLIYAKEHNLDIIRTKEYIDYDVLEKLMYNGTISDEMMKEIDDKCKEPKTKETLRCTKIKEK